jgi:mono/diheme cytochrome c family protein
VICVVLAAGAMASAPPAGHVQPVWPFAWRPSLDAWEEPELRGELLRLVIAAGGALILVVAGLVVRRFRLLAVALAAIVVAPFASSLDLLLVEAYPTSYARSTTGFSVDAIARGRILFADRCAVCHEPQTGTGSGADLTAPHLWGHLDGELFWWITSGVIDPEGAALMPGFGSVLSEDDRWALIDFVRARNIGRQAADSGKWTPPVPAPAMPLSCAGTDAGALSDLAGKILLVAAGDGPDIPGLVTIRLTREGTHAPKAGECIAAAASAWDAWAVLAGVPADQLTGKRAIVDGQGWLRAWLPPEASADQVQTAIRDARDHPIAAGARPETGHHH